MAFAVCSMCCTCLVVERAMQALNPVAEWVAYSPHQQAPANNLAGYICLTWISQTCCGTETLCEQAVRNATDGCICRRDADMTECLFTI